MNESAKLGPVEFINSFKENEVRINGKYSYIVEDVHSNLKMAGIEFDHSKDIQVDILATDSDIVYRTVQAFHESGQGHVDLNISGLEIFSKDIKSKLLQDLSFARAVGISIAGGSPECADEFGSFYQYVKGDQFNRIDFGYKLNTDDNSTDFIIKYKLSNTTGV